MATAPDRADSLWQSIRCPGLSANHASLIPIVDALRKETAVFAHKNSQPPGLLWVVFLGGTGVGKSTCFNAVCGETVSATGVERPKTSGPIVYVHQRWMDVLEKRFPFPSQRFVRQVPNDACWSPTSGLAHQVQMVAHERESFAHLALVDTPDLDSVAVQNRQMAEDLYLLADAVVFVSSQEKYADQVPFRFLERIRRDRKLSFLLLNKAEPQLSRAEILSTLQDLGSPAADERLFLLPATPLDPARFLQQNPEFLAFAADFHQALPPGEASRLAREERRRFSLALANKLDAALAVLQEEAQSTDQWLTLLDGLLEKTVHQLLDRQQGQVDEESRRHLQAEVRKIFTKYDLLAKPRRLIGQILLGPLRFLGIIPEERTDSYHVALQRLHQKIDLQPIEMAIEAFNRQVLENLSPADEAAPLFDAMRKPGVPLDRAEIKKTVWKEQDQLVKWLEETFQKLAQGIPRTTKWGIYTTSIVWGVVLLALEVMVGGGISLAQAVLDSAVAPFLTKGAVELFASSELQKLVRALADRYRRSLAEVVHEQQRRYAGLLEELSTSPEVLATLRAKRDEYLAGGVTP
ncbi:MAG TPA: hypothetical protein DEO88_09440 [Syntrophobacteraceae bacterium]|nr:hypothetical protein [Syntrophobacteraceae bacterium]